MSSTLIAVRPSDGPDVNAVYRVTVPDATETWLGEVYPAPQGSPTAPPRFLAAWIVVNDDGEREQIEGDEHWPTWQAAVNHVVARSEARS